MFKKKYFTTEHDFKTGFFYKLSLVLGFFLLFLSIFLIIFSLVLDRNSSDFLKELYIILNGTAVKSIAAFSIIFIAIGIIIYFLHRQFIKLDEIAKDIENMDEINNK